MKYKVQWKRKPTKQIMKFPKQIQIRLRDATRNLADSETWGDVKPLINHQYDYRLRVGDYRVLFNATNDQTIEINDVFIEEVKKRDDRTY